MDQWNKALFILGYTFWGYIPECILSALQCFNYVCLRYQQTVCGKGFMAEMISEVSEHFPEGLRGSDQY